MLEKNYGINSIITLAENHFLYKLDDSLMWLFNTESGEQYNLNEQSYFALSLFDGKRTVGEIRQLYVERYSKSDVSEDVIIEDFNSLLDQLINASVLTLKNK